MKKNKNEQIRKKRKIKYLFYPALTVFLISVAVLTAGNLSTFFADTYAGTVSAKLREIFAHITYKIPFSVAEVAVILIIPLILFLIIRIIVKRRLRVLTNTVIGILSVIMLMLAVFINHYGICYRTTKVEQKYGLDIENVTQDSVFDAGKLLISYIDESIDNVKFDENDFSVMPYDYGELNKKIYKGYSEIFDSMPKVLSLKKVALSEKWTYTHTSGIYVPFTGESNVNTNYPDYIEAYTAAHEIAHQLGVASEDEANFYAFLACVNSGDDYLKYSASLNMFEYLIEDLSRERAIKLASYVDERVMKEYIAYNKFFEKYDNNKIAEVSNAVNDMYLKSQGEADGIRTYSKVSALFTAYCEKYIAER